MVFSRYQDVQRWYIADTTILYQPPKYYITELQRQHADFWFVASVLEAESETKLISVFDLGMHQPNTNI